MAETTNQTISKEAIWTVVPEFKKDFIIEYADTDKMGVLHNSRYGRLLESTLSSWLRSWGSSLSQLENYGLCLPVREKRIKYLLPIRLEDRVSVLMRMQIRRGSALVLIRYDILRDARRIAHAKVSHVLCKYRRDDTTGGTRLVPIPAEWLLSLQNQ